MGIDLQDCRGVVLLAALGVLGTNATVRAQNPETTGRKCPVTSLNRLVSGADATGRDCYDEAYRPETGLMLAQFTPQSAGDRVWPGDKTIPIVRATITVEGKPPAGLTVLGVEPCLQAGEKAHRKSHAPTVTICSDTQNTILARQDCAVHPEGGKKKNDCTVTWPKVVVRTEWAQPPR